MHGRPTKGHRRWIGLTLAVGLLLASCSDDGGDSGDKAASTTTSAPGDALQNVGEDAKACALLSKDEVKDVLGADSVIQGNEDLSKGAAMGFTFCSWSTVAGDHVDIGVVESRDRYDKRLELLTGGDDSKVKMVDGLGDGAYVVPLGEADGSGRQVGVLIGDRTLEVSLQVQDKTTDDDAIALARQVVDSL